MNVNRRLKGPDEPLDSHGFAVPSDCPGLGVVRSDERLWDRSRG